MQTEFTIDLSELQHTNLKNDSLRMFYVVRKPQGITKKQSGEINKYININFHQMEEDWYSEDIYKVSDPAIKRCEP